MATSSHRWHIGTDYTAQAVPRTLRRTEMVRTLPVAGGRVTRLWGHTARPIPRRVAVTGSEDAAYSRHRQADPPG